MDRQGMKAATMGALNTRLTTKGAWTILRKRAAEAGLTVDEAERLSSHGLRASVPGHVDWLRSELQVIGPTETVARFRAAAVGSGVVPWAIDLDRMEEDFFRRWSRRRTASGRSAWPVNRPGFPGGWLV
jgi:hypothetical protein